MSFLKVENENFEIENFETCFGDFEKWKCEMRIESSGHRLRICSLFALVLALTEGRCRRADWFGFGVSDEFTFLKPTPAPNQNRNCEFRFLAPCGGSFGDRAWGLPGTFTGPTRSAEDDAPEVQRFFWCRNCYRKIHPGSGDPLISTPKFQPVLQPRFAIGPGCLYDPWPRFTPFWLRFSMAGNT